jgi:hypothetical protein
VAKRLKAKVVPTHKAPLRSVKKLPSNGAKKFPKMNVGKKAGD